MLYYIKIYVFKYLFLSMTTQTKSIQKLITFSPELHQLVMKRAKRFGLSLPEYIRILAVNDTKSEAEAIPMVDEETEKRIGESLEAYKQGEYITLKTKSDIKKYLDHLDEQV